MSRVNTSDERGPAARKRGVFRRLTLEARREVLTRFQAGASAADLAGSFGVTPRSIYRIVREESGETAAQAARKIVVAARLPREEFEDFLGTMEATGYASRSQALRALVRMANGLVEIGPGNLETVRQTSWLVGKHGVLLNQLARAVHTGKLRLTEKDRALLREAIEVCRGVETALEDISGAAERRRAHARRHLARPGRT